MTTTNQTPSTRARSVSRRVRRDNPSSDAVSRLDLFSGLTARQKRAVDSYFSIVDVAEGYRICQEGEIGREFVMVLRGQLGVTIGGEAVAVLGRGSHVGELALVDRDNPRRRASVHAMEPSVVAIANRREFTSLLDHVPDVAERILTIAAKRQRAVDEIRAGSVVEAAPRFPETVTV